MENMLIIIGLVGAGISVTAYGLLQWGVFKADNVWFYVTNGVASILILAATCVDFDKGDIGAIAINAAWLVISIIGAIRCHTNPTALQKAARK